MQRPFFVGGVSAVAWLVRRCRGTVNCRKLQDSPCSTVTPSLCFPLLLLVFYQPLTQGCRQQSWQHGCVECTVAIYRHTLMVNKDCGARAGYCTCKLFLNLSHLMWFEAGHTLEALRKGALDIPLIALTYKGMQWYTQTYRANTQPTSKYRPNHTEPHIERLGYNSLTLDTAWM